MAFRHPDARRTILQPGRNDGAEYPPYGDMAFTGWPQAMLRRGKVAIRDGVLEAEPGSGHYLPRGSAT